MAKLTRKNQKIFCADVSPNNVIAVFGSNKAGSPVYSDDPDTIQSLDAWTNGWTGAVGTNLAPSIQDMNAFFYVATRQLAYLMQGGVGEWNADITYYKDSLVSDGNGTIYRSLADDNLNNAVSDITKWSNYSSNTSKQVSGDLSSYSNEDYSFTWPSGSTGPSGSVGSSGATGPYLTGRKIVFVILSSGSHVGEAILYNENDLYYDGIFVQN